MRWAVCALYECVPYYKTYAPDAIEIYEPGKSFSFLNIKSLSGDSFSNLINGYRIRYAQKLMEEHPDMSVTEIASECGFTSRSAFYRNFKAITGIPPSEWKKKA